MYRSARPIARNTTAAITAIRLRKNSWNAMIFD